MSFRLEPYTPNWKTEFEELKQFFSDLLHDIPFAIEHVGSTAIPNMIAKPILILILFLERKKQFLKFLKDWNGLAICPKGNREYLADLHSDK